MPMRYTGLYSTSLSSLDLYSIQARLHNPFLHRYDGKGSTILPPSLFLFRATSTAPLGSLDAGLVALDLRLTHTHHTASGFPWPLELAYCRLTKQMDLH